MSTKHCSFCDATVKGSMDELIDLGWAWIVIYAPVRKKFTACPKHHAEFNDEIMNALKGRLKGKGVI